MPGDEGRLGEARWVWGYPPVTEPSCISFPPQDPGLPLKEQVEAPRGLSPLPSVTWQEARGWGWQARRRGVGLLFKLGKCSLIPHSPWRGNNLPFLPSVPLGALWGLTSTHSSHPQAQAMHEQGGGLPWLPRPTLTLPVLWVPLVQPRARGRVELG